MLDAFKDDFDYWLDEATRGLHPDALGVIAAEMLARYESAWQDAQSDGMHDARAHETAMQRLGNPKGARKSFRKSYPTRHEAWLASSGLHNYVITVAQVFVVVFSWQFEVVLDLHSGEEQWSVRAFLEVLVPTGLICMFTTMQIARAAMRRRLPAARVLSRAPLALFILPTLVWGIYGTVTQGSVIAYAVTIAYVVCFFWRIPLHWEDIYRKTRHLAEATAV